MYHSWSKRKKKQSALLPSNSTTWQEMQRGHSKCCSLKEKANGVSFCIVDVCSAFLKYKYVITMTVLSSHLSWVYLCVLFKYSFLWCSGVLKVLSCFSFLKRYFHFSLSHSRLRPNGETAVTFSEYCFYCSVSAWCIGCSLL